MFDGNFIDACLYGDTDLDELDDYVEYWHTHETEISLREFLGMTEYEYESWLKSDNLVIRDILRARVDRVPFEDYQFMSSQERIAARSWDINEIEKLMNDDKHGDE